MQGGNEPVAGKHVKPTKPSTADADSGAVKKADTLSTRALPPDIHKHVSDMHQHFSMCIRACQMPCSHVFSQSLNAKLRRKIAIQDSKAHQSSTDSHAALLKIVIASGAACPPGGLTIHRHSVQVAVTQTVSQIKCSLVLHSG